MVKGGKKRKEKKNTEEGRLESLWWEPMSCSCSCDSKGQRDVGKRSKRSREEWPNRVIASVPLWPFVPRWFHIYLFTFLSLLYLCLLALFFFVCSDFRGENLPALSCHNVMGRMNGIIFRFQAAATTTSSSRSYIFWWLLACVKATVKAAARAHGSPHYSPKYLKIVFFFFLISGQRERERKKKKIKKPKAERQAGVCVCIQYIIPRKEKEKKKFHRQPSFRTDVSQRDSYRHNQPPVGHRPLLCCSCWPVGWRVRGPFRPLAQHQELLLVRTLSIT